MLERPGLTFGIGGIGQVPIADVDVARCFNVLYYFTDDFIRQALEWFASTLAEGGLLLTGGDWAFTTECRYFLHQRLDGRLQAREFGFSLDNVVPLTVVPFYALHDDSRELAMLFRLVRTLRRDRPFLNRYYDVVDTLRAEHGIGTRLDDGGYGALGEAADPVALWTEVAAVSEKTSTALGPDAVAVLQRAGWDARLDEIGCVAVSLASVPPEA
jgi:hypothetical protein